MNHKDQVEKWMTNIADVGEQPFVTFSSLKFHPKEIYLWMQEVYKGQMMENTVMSQF